MKIYSRTKLLQTFSYIILLLVMIMSVGVLTLKIVLKSSENVERTGEMEKARIALSYVNMMVKQNSREDNIKAFEDGFVIEGYDDVDELKCAIYYRDGSLYEAVYNGDFAEENGEKIVDVRGMKIEMKDRGLLIRVDIEEGSMSRFISFRNLSNRAGGM